MSVTAIKWGALSLVLAGALCACAGSDPARLTCEGLQVRARLADPLADAKTARDQPSCQQYEAERKRLLPAPAN